MATKKNENCLNKRNLKALYLEDLVVFTWLRPFLSYSKWTPFLHIIYFYIEIDNIEEKYTDKIATLNKGYIFNFLFSWLKDTNWMLTHISSFPIILC